MFYANGMPVVTIRTLRRANIMQFDLIYLIVGVLGCASSVLAALLMWRRRRTPEESILFYYAYLLLCFYDCLTLFFRVWCMDSMNLEGFVDPYKSNIRFACLDPTGWPFSNLNINMCLTSYWIASCFCVYFLMWTHAIHRMFAVAGKKIPILKSVPTYYQIVFILCIPIIPIYVLTVYDTPIPGYPLAYMGVFYNPILQNTYGWYFPIVMIYDAGPALWICTAPHLFALITELQIYLKQKRSRVIMDAAAINHTLANLLINGAIVVAWFFFAGNAVVSEELRFKRPELFPFFLQHLQVWIFNLGIPIVIIGFHLIR